MNKLYAFIVCLAFLLPSQAFGAFGFEATDGAFVIIDAGSGDESYRLTPSTGSEDPFLGHDFDDDNTSTDFFNYGTNPLIITDLIANTFETGGDDIVGVTLYLRSRPIDGSFGDWFASDLKLVSTNGVGGETYGLAKPIDLTAPGIGNIGNKVILELYLEAETAGGGLAYVDGRDDTDAFWATYTGQAIPEPEVSTLLAFGIIGIRVAVVQLRKKKKREALHADQSQS